MLKRFPLLCLISPVLFLCPIQIAIAQTSPTLDDPRGPIAAWVGRTQVNDQGVQAVNYTFQPSTDKTPWRPNWVWVPGAEGIGQPPFAAHFRKEVILPPGTHIARAYAKVSADRRYRLWINGRLLSRGPDDPGSDVAGAVKWSHQWLNNRVDLTPFLRVGKNVIAVEVITSGRIPGFGLGKSGFAFEATVTRTEGAPIMITTSAGWKAQACRAYTEGRLASANDSDETGILYDARLESSAWRKASFSSSTWKSAKRIDSVWGPLLVSEIPPSMEAIWPAQSISRATPNVTTTAPFARLGQEIRIRGNGTFSVDYDRVLSAYISVKVRGHAGTIITLEPAETKTAPHPVLVAQVTLREGETIFEYPAYSSFSTIKITASHATGEVEFADVRATFVSQPVTYRGSFMSSDEALNRLWKSARWLTQMCMQDRYLDSPHNQEPLGDSGDYLIEALENAYAFGEPWLARQDLRKFANMLDHSNDSTFHTSYALLWLQMLMNFYDYTGDEGLLRELAPTANRLLDHFATYQGANGLLSEAPNYMFMDWVTIAGFNGHHPPAVIGQGYLTAFYYKALGDGGRLSAIAGDDARKLKYEQLQSHLRSAFNQELWDEKAGLYRDGNPHTNHQPLGPWLPEDKDIVTHSPQVNTLAVLYDLGPKDRQQLILTKLFSSPPLNVQPYFMHFVFAAEDHAGVFDEYAGTQMQRWHLDPETRTFSEDWNSGDHSHAWGGTPLIQMSARILGVTPASAGYRRVAIQPHLCGLDWAKGVVPTPMGDVRVSWTNKDALFTLEITTPQEMDAEVILPQLPFANGILVIDGKQSASSAGAYSKQRLALAGGTHRITIEGQVSSR